MAWAMFNNGETFEIDKVAEYLKSNWNTTVSDIKGDSCALAFSINGETVVLASMPVQIPFDVIKGTVQYLYNWQTAEKDLEDHNSHVIVSVLSSNKK